MMTRTMNDDNDDDDDDAADVFEGIERHSDKPTTLTTDTQQGVKTPKVQV